MLKTLKTYGPALLATLSILVPILIFIANSKRIEITITKYRDILHVKIDDIKTSEDIKIYISDKEVNSLRSVHLRIENSGNVAVSSVEKSMFFNLIDYIKLRFKSDFEGEVVGLQLENDDKIDYGFNNYTKGEPEIYIKFENLNPGEFIDLAALVSSDNQALLEVTTNPVQNGNIKYLDNSQKNDSEFQLPYVLRLFGGIFYIFIPILLLMSLIMDAFELPRVYKNNLKRDRLIKRIKSRRLEKEEEAAKIKKVNVRFGSRARTSSNINSVGMFFLLLIMVIIMFWPIAYVGYKMLITVF